MKIIQSFWSAPAAQNKKGDEFGPNSGGWATEKMHAMSWMLSCCKFRQFYPDVELYTDAACAEWLADRLALPYPAVHKTLDAFTEFDPSLWASTDPPYDIQELAEDFHIFMNRLFIAKQRRCELQGYNFPEKHYSSRPAILEDRPALSPLSS